MNLQFDSLAELERMIRALGYVRRDTIAELTCGEITLRGSEQFVKDLTEAGHGVWDHEQPESARKSGTVVACAEHLANTEHEVAELVEHGRGAHRYHEPAAPFHQPVEHEVQAELPKRKRRTKAETEAEKAAQSTAAIVAATETGTDHEAPVTHNPLDNLKPEPAVSLNSEIAEMAALFDGTDRLAHINEGRDFIAKHGFPTYNETMQLADVPANIAGHTPEQVSRHRAAMAWKAAQLAGG